MSFLETLVILVVAVVVLGPNRLPEAARKIGRFMGMIRQAGDEFKRQLMMMDQKIEQTTSQSTVDLDQLVPTDEELATMMATDASQTPPSVPLGTPPTSSPDDLWDVPPVPGGTLEEKPTLAAETPVAETPSEEPPHVAK